MKRSIISILVFSFASIASISFQQETTFSKLTNKINYKLPGQTAPSDMIFVAGNGEMESFYISARKEPNINYVIYLKWLIKVYYESYPEYVLQALPSVKDSLVDRNGVVRYLSYEYMFDPAFAYHPIVGLSWEQIQRYLAWKGDRLNEQILIKTGIYKPVEQKDEDTFVTGAFLAGQYEGNYEKYLTSMYKMKYTRNRIPSKSLKLKKRKGERTPELGDGCFFMGYRLPTATEWDYVKNNISTTTQSFENGKHPYGHNYFLLNANRQLENYRGERIDESRYNRQKHFSIIPHALIYYDIDAFLNHNLNNYAINHNSKSYIPKEHFLTVPASYGVIDFDSEISEWVLDKYQPATLPQSDWRLVLQNGNFRIGGMNAVKDEYGNYVEKNRYGYLKYIRFLGMGTDGVPLEVENYVHNHRIYNRRYIRDEIKNIEIIIKNLESQLEQTPYYATIIKNYEKEVESLRTRLMIDDKEMRMIKGLETTHLAENQFRKDIGFRCVLTFTGAPVLKELKVNWRK